MLIRLFLIFLSLSCPAQAQPRLAVLDFELKDMTLAPGIKVEIERTAAIKPMLVKQLQQAGYDIIQINKEQQQLMDSGVGYLFNHPDVAAQLAQGNSADYILVGRLHKPSFLFSYLMVQLIEVKSAQLKEHWIVEVKGPQKKLTFKGVESIVVKINSYFKTH